MRKVKQDNYKPKPAFTGAIKCPRGHVRLVVDLNVEKITTVCPVNGCYTDIKEAIKAAQDEQQR